MRVLKIPLLLICCSIFPLININSQDNTNPVNKSEEITPSDSLTPDKIRNEENIDLQISEENADKTGNETLLEKTIISDINTSDYYDLVSWCRYLGINETGSKQELKKRLADFYKKEVHEDEDKTESGKYLSIEAAERTEYFTIDKIDEKYIKISGNVILEMKDTKKDVTHLIKTDRILFNQNENIITATGNVNYTRISGEDRENFKGEKLSFDITNWEGMFFRGVSEKDKTQDDKDLKFYYSGEKIYRSEEDVIIIDDASITSSKLEDPYYHLKAKRIWVLAPGEWGIKNAVLYVGHVPTFYFPFFFHPGDKLVFNPALGSKDAVGFFFQTTTYLKGSPDTSQNLSFLALTEEEGEYETELNGIYLRKTRVKEKADESSDFIKIMFDIYSRLGIFSGIELYSEEQGPFKETKMFTGIGRSRNIYINSDGYYSPFFESDEGKYESSWNEGNFLQYTLPFRFGFELDSGFTANAVDSDFSFELYSDPYVLRDFNDREESVDWSKLLGLEEEEETDDSDFTGIRDRLWWSVHLSYTPEIDFFDDYLRQVNITKLDFSMNWKNKTRSTTGVTGLDSSLSGYIPSSNRSEYFMPEKNFYYPENYTLPEFSASVTGDIFSKTWAYKELPDKYKADEENKIKNSDKVSPPWKETEEEKETEYSDYSDIIESETLENLDIKLYEIKNPFSHSLTYKFSPNFTSVSTLKYDSWDEPDDIDFDKSYSTIRTYGDINLNYTADYYEDLVSLDNYIILSYDFKQHNSRGDNISDETWQTYKDADSKSTFTKLENKAGFTSYPLYKHDSFDQSFIKYQLDTILFEKKYDYTDTNGDAVFKDSFFEWDKDSFTENELDMNLKYLSNWNQIQHIRLRTVLPPLLQEIENENIARTGPLTSTLIVKTVEIREDVWDFDPLIWKEKYGYDDLTYIEQIMEYDSEDSQWETSETIGRLSFYDDELYFKQTYKYDLMIDTPDELVSTVNLWFFNTEYKAEYKKPWTYNQSTGWQEEDNEEFVPSEFNAEIDFSRYFYPVWRNRIRYKTNISTAWEMDLQKFTENSLLFNFGFDLNVSKFLDLSFSTVSENNSTYRYFPKYAEEMGEEWVNPFDDLLKSFNFFDTNSRYESFFKLKSIECKAIHHLHDWDLTLEYSGEPKLYTPDSGSREWRWDSKLTILMQWNPIPEIKSDISISDTDITM